MSDSRAEDEAAIQAVLVDSYKAWEAGDADGMVANYTAEATAIMTGSLRDSRDVIRENMALAFEGPLKGSSTYNKQLSFRFVGRDAEQAQLLVQPRAEPSLHAVHEVSDARNGRGFDRAEVLSGGRRGHGLQH